MNLLEALKSGRPFKRAHWINYIDYRGIRPTHKFWTDDALQNDWEVEDRPRRFILNLSSGLFRDWPENVAPPGWILVREEEP